MDDRAFTKKYEDVLQNLEFTVVQVARQHPEMDDWEPLQAVEALIKVYRDEMVGREADPPVLAPLANEIYAFARGMCEWRLGREPLFDEDGQPVDVGPDSIAVEEIVACLKRIRRSIRKWNKRGGRQGYLTFIDQFFP